MAKQTNTTEQAATTNTKDFTADLKKLDTKSAQIRFLDSQGLSRGQIAKTLSAFHGKEVRYQHVRNVLVTPVKQPRS